MRAYLIIAGFLISGWVPTLKIQAQNASSNFISLDEVFARKLRYADSINNAGFSHDALSIYYDLIQKKEPYAGELQFRLHMDMGRLFLRLNMSDEARKQIKKAQKFAIFDTVVEPVQKINMYALLAILELGEENFQESVTAFERNVMISRKYKLPLFEASSLNNLGITHTQMGQYEVAMTYYIQSLELTEILMNILKEPSQAWDLRFSIMDNIAELYVLQGKNKEAYDMYWMIVDSVPQSVGMGINHKRDRWVKSLTKASSLPIEIQGTDPFLPLLVQASDTYNLLEKSYKKAEIRSALYQELAKRFVMAGDVKNAQHWMSEALDFKDRHSEHRIEQLNNTLMSTANYNFDQLIRQKKLESRVLKDQIDLKEEKSKKRAILSALIFVMAAGAMIVLWLFLNRRLLLEKEKTKLNEVRNELLEEQLKNEELEKRRVQDSLLHKQKDVSNLSMFVSRQQKWAKELVKLRRVGKREGLETMNERLSGLIMDMQNDVVLDEKQALINEKIEEVGSEFISGVREKFPKLTSQELELCSLIRLRLSNKEIARIRNISDESARKARYRLKKKMGYAEEQNLEDELNTLEREAVLEG